MKAALLVRPGRIDIEDVPEPEVGPDEVGIAVGGVGLCGSDLSVFSGAWTRAVYPWVMGHEAFGTIDSVGRGVDPRAHRPDGRGRAKRRLPHLQCGRGLTSACVARQSVGMNRPGALAERLVVPARFAWPIHGVPPTDLVCVEPMAVVTAALRRTGSPLPASATVVGGRCPGPADVSCSPRSDVEVHVRDVNPERVASATRLGATAALDGDERRFDLVVDTVGSPGTADVALEASRWAGRCSSSASTTTRGRSLPRRSSGARPSCGAR